MAKRASDIDNQCPCGLPEIYERCCGRYVSGQTPAPTAEALMRSRYSAYAKAEGDYLRDTWHPKTRPSRVRLDPEQKWIGLSIKDTEAGQLDDAEGVVEFVARFKINGRGHRLRERSRFEKLEGKWYYLDGKHLDT